MALTLESMRNADEDGDGILDNEDVTVFDARDAMMGLSRSYGKRVY